MKPTYAFALFLSLTVLPLAAQAGPDRGPRAEKIAHALNLTEAQQTGIRSIREKHRPDFLQRRAAMQHAQIDLRTALQDSATPDAQLRILYDKAAAARFEMMLARRSVHKEVQALLTPEQRAMAAELRDRHQARMRERMRHADLGPGMPG
jgi:Spy/CpxP family protein refolding chaperone